MRTIGVVEAVTFPGLDEILIRQRAPQGGHGGARPLPAGGCDYAPLHQVVVATDSPGFQTLPERGFSLSEV
jgi:hypothetical protein